MPDFQELTSAFNYFHWNSITFSTFIVLIIVFITSLFSACSTVVVGSLFLVYPVFFLFLGKRFYFIYILFSNFFQFRFNIIPFFPFTQFFSIFSDAFFNYLAFWVFNISCFIHQYLSAVLAETIVFQFSFSSTSDASVLLISSLLLFHLIRLRHLLELRLFICQVCGPSFFRLYC